MSRFQAPAQASQDDDVAGGPGGEGDRQGRDPPNRVEQSVDIPANLPPNVIPPSDVKENSHMDTMPQDQPQDQHQSVPVGVEHQATSIVVDGVASIQVSGDGPEIVGWV